MNSEQKAQECDATEDEFCTGADFIIKLMIEEIALASPRNKNTFTLAFRFLLVKLVMSHLFFLITGTLSSQRTTQTTPV